MLRVIDYIDGTIVDGPGLRTSIYFAGCRHACPGCHNPTSWSFDAGKEVSIDEIINHVKENGFNITLTGGDPLYQIDEVIKLCIAIRKLGLNIWCYTGFTYEEVLSDKSLKQILSYIDVLVDGPFIKELRDIGLRFRGSSNQRLIDVSKSKVGEIVLWE